MNSKEIIVDSINSADNLYLNAKKTIIETLEVANHTKLNTLEVNDMIVTNLSVINECRVEISVINESKIDANNFHLDTLNSKSKTKALRLN